jgi:hypothetical protein
MSDKTRGSNAVRMKASVPHDVRWGLLNPDEWVGRVTLMQHPTYGELFFKNDEVENRTSRGWVAVEYTDPTIKTPTAMQEPGAVIGSRPPTERDEVMEKKIPVVTKPRQRTSKRKR